MVRSFIITIGSFLSSLPKRLSPVLDTVETRSAAVRSARTAITLELPSRTSERTQDHVELGLELRDSSELDAQLSFSVAEPLVDRPGRCDGGRTASNCARSGGCTGRRKCQSSHGVLRSRERMPR